MIKSMTGFGHAEKVTSQCKITVELKSVNHRYLDLNIKMPRRFNMLEGQVRNLLKQYMQRGKVDVFITYEDYTSSDYTLKYNKDLAAEYLRYLNQMAEEFHLENDIRVTALSRYPEVLSMEEQSVDEEELWKLLSDPLKEACTKFVETRISATLQGKRCFAICDLPLMPYFPVIPDDTVLGHVTIGVPPISSLLQPI